MIEKIAKNRQNLRTFFANIEHRCEHRFSIFSIWTKNPRPDSGVLFTEISGCTLLTCQILAVRMSSPDLSGDGGPYSFRCRGSG